jgi:hypothetical protein
MDDELAHVQQLLREKSAGFNPHHDQSRGASRA